MTERNKIICGDWKEAARQLAPASIDCIITSPPYYGLRDYGTATWKGGDADCDHVERRIRTGDGLAQLSEAYRGGGHKAAEVPVIQFRGECGKCGAVSVDQQIGQEETPEAYISSLVEGFRILRTALKDTGTLWVNIGDSYASSGKVRTNEQATRKSGLKGGFASQIAAKNQPAKRGRGLKDKDLIGIPWMLAFALRADGWYLRQDIIWHKPNPMPESVTDRCTKSHEYIFLFSKSSQYYYDAEAIKEDTAEYEFLRRQKEKAKGLTGKQQLKSNGFEMGQTPQSENGAVRDKAAKIDPALSGKRNKRSVWTVTTKPFADAHFACYPHELIDPCILAGTSEKGNCPKCGGPWSRILEPVLNVGHTGDTESQYQEGTTANRLTMLRQAAREQGTEYTGEKKTIGWQPSCECGISETVPAIVYDPFTGSGTTASAAKSLGRAYMGSELNPEYIKIINKRLHKELGLFNL